MSDAAEDVDVDVEIDGSRTLITVSGQRKAALVVESSSGERIYLPPEGFDADASDASQTPYDSPYDGVAETPYDAAMDAESPYDAGESPYDSGAPREQVVGVQPTADGFRVLHPEPVTDLRLLR